MQYHTKLRVVGVKRIASLIFAAEFSSSSHLKLGRALWRSTHSIREDHTAEAPDSYCRAELASAGCDLH